MMKSNKSIGCTFSNVLMMINLKIITVFLTLICVFGFTSYAQEESDVTNQLWLDYYFYYLPKEGIKLTGDLGYRNRFSASEWNQFIARGSVLYRYKSWLSLFGGFGFFFTDIKEITNTLEIRPWIGSMFILNADLFSQTRFTNLTRIEERFVINTQESGTSNDIRLRNRTDVRIPINNYLFVDNTVYLRFEIEVFTNTKNITEQLADKLRLAVGIGYRFTYEWRIEIDFYVQRLKNTTDAGFSVTDNIWRFGLRHYL
jgi:hypothetical protein